MAEGLGATVRISICTQPRENTSKGIANAKIQHLVIYCTVIEFHRMWVNGRKTLHSCLNVIKYF